jgi:hypothetical protein
MPKWKQIFFIPVEPKVRTLGRKQQSSRGSGLHIPRVIKKVLMSISFLNCGQAVEKLF